MLWHVSQLYSVSADQPMLLPLTSALYVSAKLASHDSILLDIGTGYYAEVGSLHLTVITHVLLDHVGCVAKLQAADAEISG